jgi:hypothetical protein
MVNLRCFQPPTRLLAGVILWCLLGLAPALSAAEVEAMLDRESVPAGNGAMLTLRISGGRAQPPQMPVVENLIFQQGGQSQEMRIVNGITSVSVAYSYVVGSHIPGDYQIPPIKVKVDGEEIQTQPLRLKVLDSAAGQPPAGMPGTDAGDETDGGERRFGFLTVEFADNNRTHAYVGEIAPVRIRAWIPADSRANLRSGIQPEAKGFTLHNVSDRPQQTEEMRDGKRYLVVTWFGGISATRAGKYPASLSVDATVAVRDTNALKPPARRRGGFFDQMFEDMNVPMIQKDVTLKSEDQEIEVRPLPKEGRPAGFTGAVGDFKFDGVEIPAAWTTGEPQQVRARLSGSGNFALMKAPELTPPDAWKSYPGIDEFTAGDNASFSGAKVFQFSAVPRKSGSRETSLQFSYFDPAAGEYRTIVSPAHGITVTGDDLAEDQIPEEPAPVTPPKKEGGLVAQRQEISDRASLVPLVSRPAFIPLLGAGGSLALLGLMIAGVRHRLADPQRLALAAVEKAVEESLANAGQCAAAGNVAGFFAAARLAIQHRLGRMWNQPALAITLAEVQGRMPHESPVARFFIEADRHAYSPTSGAGIAPEWKSLLNEAMTSLKPSDP